MPADLNDIVLAIQEHWKLDAPLVDVVPELSLGVARDQSKSPVAVMTIVAHETSRVLGEPDIEMLLFDLVIYDKGRSPRKALNVLSRVIAAYEQADIQFRSGKYATVVVIKLPTGAPVEQDPDGVWQAMAQFQGQFQEIAA